MNVYDLLEIKKPEGMFTGTLDDIRKQYRALAKDWHPDTNKDNRATAVFSHVSSMYHEALDKITKCTWEGSGFISVNKKEYAYGSQHPFELGNCYVGTDYVIYRVEKTYTNLFQNAVLVISGFKYATNKMRQEMEKYLPREITGSIDNYHYLIIKKDPGLVPLRDVVDYYDQMDPKHVAWIQSSLHNICCYLNYAGLSHNAISIDNYFIDPDKHVGALLGGWWYATPFNSPLHQVPNKLLPYLPWDVKLKKIASDKTDLELTRAMGRELLGDISGTKLNTKTPEPMAAWLKAVVTESAINDYQNWDKVLIKSFGKKRFTKMDLDFKEIQTTRFKPKTKSTDFDLEETLRNLK